MDVLNGFSKGKVWRREEREEEEEEEGGNNSFFSSLLTLSIRASPHQNTHIFSESVQKKKKNVKIAYSRRKKNIFFRSLLAPLLIPFFFFEFFYFVSTILCGDHASTSGVLQLLLGDAGHVTRLDDDGAGQETLSEKLEHSLGGQVDDGHLGGLGVLSGDHGSDLGHVARGLVCDVLLEVVVAHTNLTEVPRVVLVKPDPVVVLSSGVSAS